MGPGLCPPPSSSGFREPSSCAHSVSESSVLATQTWPQHVSRSPSPGLAPRLPQTLPSGGLALLQHRDRTQGVDSLSYGLGAREMVSPSLKGVTCGPVEQPAPRAVAMAAGSFYHQRGALSLYWVGITVLHTLRRTDWSMAFPFANQEIRSSELEVLHLHSPGQ